MQNIRSEKLQSLIEQRVYLATQRQMSTKLLTIAKYLGKPVYSTSIFDNYLSDTWNNEDQVVYDPTVLNEAPEDWSDTLTGFYFDGLRFGINLAVTVVGDYSYFSEGKITYNGYLVYAEIEGKVKAYAPFPAWEGPLDMFYQGAVDKEKEKSIADKEEQKVDRRKKWKDFWDSFKLLWGV